MHFSIYLDLTLLYNLIYKIKFLIVFFKVLSNFVVYLLMQSFFIKLFNINLSNKSLNILSNFFKSIAFQFYLKRY